MKGLKALEKMKAMKQKQKAFTSQFKKPKKDSRKLPKAKKGNGKALRFVLWALLLILVVAAPLAFIRSGNALISTADNEKTLQKVQEHVGGVQDYSRQEIEVFGDHVVDAYMNIPQKGEKRSENAEQLKRYFAEGVPIPSYNEFKGYRVLENKTLYNIKEHQGRIILQYKVDYTNVAVEEVEKEVEKEVKEGDETKTKTVTETVEEEHKTAKSALLNLLIHADQGRYIVAGNPYYSDIPTLIGEGKRITNSRDGQEQVGTQKKQQIQTWLEEFFTTYAEGNQEELHYMMEYPQSLGGLQSFVSLQDVHIYPIEGEQRYVVKTGVTFQEQDIPVQHKENFTLKIEKRDDRYYVQELTNTLGGQ